ncbi:MAG TPA: hypothetical protein VE007_07670, partial [Thermoanaerobaculia bacterium]|nr:hypothetical protein [Thermoanaerobaculia bacterium]
MRLAAAASLVTCLAVAAAANPTGDGALLSAKNVGLAALEEGNLPEAAKRFETVRRLAPAEPLGWADGAVAALRAKNFPEAKTLAAEALKRSPRDARVLAIDAARAEAAGETAAAVSAYERAAAASPKDLASRWSAARLLLAASPPDRDRARRHLEAALAEAPGNQFLLFRLLEVERSTGDRTRALATFERVARSVETREARIDRALAEAKAALEGSDTAAADVKVRILE